MTDALSDRPRLPAREPARASARLGLTLRTVLLAPRQGFESALAATDRRARAGRRPAEGFSTYVLAALGGVALASLWLKVGALFKLRNVCAAGDVTGYVIAALALGSLLALGAQALWGSVGVPLVHALRGDATRHNLRLVWGASAVPQVFVLLILLPLDLVIVGTDTFTTRPLGESLATAWAALSIALAISAAIWSLYLFLRGVEVSAGIRTRQALLGVAVAALCLVAVVGLFVVATMFVPKEAACPTRPA